MSETKEKTEYVSQCRVVDKGGNPVADWSDRCGGHKTLEGAIVCEDTYKKLIGQFLDDGCPAVEVDNIAVGINAVAMAGAVKMGGTLQSRVIKRHYAWTETIDVMDGEGAALEPGLK